MAVKNGNVRVTVTVPGELLDAIRAEAEAMGLSVSGYIAMTMRANSFLGDERMAEAANYRMQELKDRALGYAPMRGASS